jgi:hypothetical protein
MVAFEWGRNTKAEAATTMVAMADRKMVDDYKQQ